MQMMEETATLESTKSGVKRPMNAFLIFCKRHRGVVREKNPNVDNRSVTRILGDLWANLDVDEKSTYTNLAKQVSSLSPIYCAHFSSFIVYGKKTATTIVVNRKLLFSCTGFCLLFCFIYSAVDNNFDTSMSVWLLTWCLMLCCLGSQH